MAKSIECGLKSDEKKKQESALVAAAECHLFDERAAAAQKDSDSGFHFHRETYSCETDATPRGSDGVRTSPSGTGNKSTGSVAARSLTPSRPERSTFRSVPFRLPTAMWRAPVVFRSEASPAAGKSGHVPTGDPSAKLELESANVDVWHCFLDEFGDTDAALALLDAGEIRRYHGFMSEDARRQFLAGRALMRTALSCYANVPERVWTFAANEHGRLTIDEPREHRDLYFNLSHTSEVAVLAIGRLPEIGIDVEAIDRPVDIEWIARTVFTQSEADSILTGASGSERDRFFDLWTLKEAYMKARGRGFSLRPNSFELDSVDGHIVLQWSHERDPSPGRWQFHLFSPRPNLRVALAIGSRSVTHIKALAIRLPTGDVNCSHRLDNRPLREFA